jgi:hypothetical protein
MGSILSWFALSMWIYTSQPLHNTFMAQQTLIKPGAQVGEMFANYNLIAASFFFYCHYWQNIRVEFTHFVALAGTWSYVCLFHN